MKKFFYIFLITFAFCILIQSNEAKSAWDQEAAKFMPLQVGNTWVYKSEIWTFSWFCYAYEKIKIIDTIRVNGKFYFSISKNHTVFYPVCNQQQFPVSSRLFQFTNLRLDSNTLNLYSLNNCIIDSLKAKKGDSVKVCPNYYVPVICDTASADIFGSNRVLKNYIFHTIETTELMQYAKDIGLNKYICNQPGPSGRSMILQGCVINGILIGDTNTLVGFQQTGTEVSEKFSLSQNYPNPFNPVTKIKFSIPQNETTHGAISTRLIIYDALGKEAAILVNQQLQPGTYEADWDASLYPSGVYYYKLKVETSQRDVFTYSKKMVLIK